MSIHLSKRLVKWLRSALVRSTTFHLRQNPAMDTDGVVALFDRFLEGKARYDLEWDDFISWKNENPHVEQIRQRIASWEPLLFSSDPADKALYKQRIADERERLAALLGVARK